MKKKNTRFQPKLKIKKDDTVKVITGADKVKQGRVLQVIPEKNRVVIEGINVVKKHEKPSAANPQGGIVEQEASVHISNVMFVDESGDATRVGRRVEDGKVVRYSKKSDKTIK